MSQKKSGNYYSVPVPKLHDVFCLTTSIKMLLILGWPLYVKRWYGCGPFIAIQPPRFRCMAFASFGILQSDSTMRVHDPLLAGVHVANNCLLYLNDIWFNRSAYQDQCKSLFAQGRWSDVLKILSKKITPALEYQLARGEFIKQYDTVRKNTQAHVEIALITSSSITSMLNYYNNFKCCFILNAMKLCCGCLLLSKHNYSSLALSRS